ncbi:hypothetical protein [Paenibacillus amylolyticus]|uniref:hypothetical protein n=1 Tax=Paenibacillus amylolyticus TaxID=1451 RepID=UPI003D955176
MYEMIYQLIRSFIELIYFISGIVLAIIAIYGLRQFKIALDQLTVSIKQVEIGMEQVSLLKHDIEVRNKRLSVEKSIEFIERYKNTIFPLAVKHRELMEQYEYSFYTEDVIDIKEFPFSNQDDFKKAFDKTIKTEANDLFNEIELFSSAFTSRLADEELAFQPLGKTFVRLIDRNYDIFCVCRSSAPYANTVKLYITWKERLKKNELDKQINQLEKARSKIKNTKITPLGLDEQLEA